MKNVLLLDGHYAGSITMIDDKRFSTELAIYNNDLGILRSGTAQYRIMVFNKQLRNGAFKECHVGTNSGCACDTIERNYREQIRRWLFAMPLQWKRPKLTDDPQSASHCAEYIIHKLGIYDRELAYHIQHNLGGDWQNGTSAFSINGRVRPTDIHASSVIPGGRSPVLHKA